MWNLKNQTHRKKKRKKEEKREKETEERRKNQRKEKRKPNGEVMQAPLVLSPSHGQG